MVALDIDGTIVDFDGNMTDEMRSTIRELVAAGVEVVLATGRSLLATRTIIEDLGLQHGWAVSSNGAITTRLDPSLPGGYEISDTITFDPGPALRVLRRSEERRVGKGGGPWRARWAAEHTEW